jgi:hypothetical protein
VAPPAETSGKQLLCLGNSTAHSFAALLLAFQHKGQLSKTRFANYSSASSLLSY